MYDPFRADSVTFCFDDYDKASEMRIQFYAKEREKRADRPPKAGEYLCPVTDRLFKYEDRPLEKERIPEITATTMPCRWSRAWNCKDAKIRVWEVTTRCTIPFLCRCWSSCPIEPTNPLMHLV